MLRLLLPAVLLLPLTSPLLKPFMPLLPPKSRPEAFDAGTALMVREVLALAFALEPAPTLLGRMACKGD